jgi:hypothetical protein
MTHDHKQEMQRNMMREEPSDNYDRKKLSSTKMQRWQRVRKDIMDHSIILKRQNMTGKGTRVRHGAGKASEA